MGRELRKVPANWKHPKNEYEAYIPMYEKFPYSLSEVLEGLKSGWLVGIGPHYNVQVMPNWKKEEKTHYQMYENTSEGTPISPPLASSEELAKWLTDNSANAGGGGTATYEQWLKICVDGGRAPTFILTNGILYSGVEAL